jgi:hypothetical protein
MTFAIAAKSGTGFAADNRADGHGQHGRLRSGCNRRMAGSPQFAKSRNGPVFDRLQGKRRHFSLPLSPFKFSTHDGRFVQIFTSAICIAETVNFWIPQPES